MIIITGHRPVLLSIAPIIENFVACMAIMINIKAAKQLPFLKTFNF